MPNIATYLAQSISKAPLYDNVQAAMLDYDDTFRKEEREETPRIAQRINMKSRNYNNANMDEKGWFEMLAGRGRRPCFISSCRFGQSLLC